ncbi:MAG: hypothetical protein ACR2IT_03485, partial [Pirellulales bacterium]
VPLADVPDRERGDGRPELVVRREYPWLALRRQALLGMTNLISWNVAPGNPGADTLLVYLLAHRSADAAKASFGAFRQDPDWIAARTESEKEAGGPLTLAKGGVVSEFLVPTCDAFCAG